MCWRRPPLSCIPGRGGKIGGRLGNFYYHARCARDAEAQRHWESIFGGTVWGFDLTYLLTKVPFIFRNAF